MKVVNLIFPRSQRPIANQYVITSDDGCLVSFQSYQTEILRQGSDGLWCLNRRFYLGDPSVRTRTTVRNLGYFLQQYTPFIDVYALEKSPDVLVLEF